MYTHRKIVLVRCCAVDHWKASSTSIRFQPKKKIFFIVSILFGVLMSSDFKNYKILVNIWGTSHSVINYKLRVYYWSDVINSTTIRTHAIHYTTKDISLQIFFYILIVSINEWMVSLCKIIILIIIEIHTTRLWNFVRKELYGVLVLPTVQYSRYLQLNAQCLVIMNIKFYMNVIYFCANYKLQYLYAHKKWKLYCILCM